jgi:hypothetical protein
MLHPVETATVPVAESESHILDVRGHVLKIVAAVTGIHNEFTTFLSECHSVAIELSVLFDKLSLDMEFVLCIDRMLASISVLTWHIVEDIKCAFTTSVTVVELSSPVRGVTLVRSGVECVSIGLLNIKLRAPVTTDLIRITVLEGVRVVIDCWHEDSVESGNTATADFTQVDIVFENASEQIWRVIG